MAYCFGLQFWFPLVRTNTFFYEPNFEETLVYEFSAHDTTELLTLHLSSFEFILLCLEFSATGLCIPLLPHDLFLFFMRLKHLQFHRIDHSFVIVFAKKNKLSFIFTC